MVIGTLRFLPPPSRRLDVLEILASIQGPVLIQPGCVSCHVYEGQGDDPAIVLVERWATEEALEAHIRSDEYRSILGALELSGSPPEVTFEHVSETEGMGLIERIRSPDHRAGH
jgi:quinol monooxygenase YgiN